MEDVLKTHCTPEEIVMIDAFLSGSTKTDAFKKAFPERASKAKALGQSALQAFQKKQVVAEMERRKAMKEKVEEESAETEMARLRKMWSREHHLQKLLELAQWSEEMKIKAKSDRDKQGAGKLERDTYESIGKFMGYDAPVKFESDSKVTVTFGSGQAGEDDGEDWTG